MFVIAAVTSSGVGVPPAEIIVWKNISCALKVIKKVFRVVFVEQGRKELIALIEICKIGSIPGPITPPNAVNNSERAEDKAVQRILHVLTAGVGLMTIIFVQQRVRQNFDFLQQGMGKVRILFLIIITECFSCNTINMMDFLLRISSKPKL